MRLLLRFVALIITFTLVAVPTAASANTYTPYGCDVWGYGGWANSCKLGPDASKWVREADYVVGSQRIISGTTNVGSIDGIYGPQTTAAMKDFQEQEALPQDGVVGSQTWTALQGRLQHKRQDTYFYYYTIAFVVGENFAKRKVSPYDWWVIPRGGGDYVRLTATELH